MCINDGTEIALTADSEIIRVLNARLPSLDVDQAFWWRTTGYTLANMLRQAGYSLNAQYESLLFYRFVVVPSLGSRPEHDGSILKWPSYVTDDFSPIEYSWNWDGLKGTPKIPFAIEAMGSQSGSGVDPFNQAASKELISRLSVSVSGIDLALFNHFWSTLLVFSQDSSLINDRASFGDHRISLFIACEFEGAGLMIKAYFMLYSRLSRPTSPELASYRGQSQASTGSLSASIFLR